MFIKACFQNKNTLSGCLKKLCRNSLIESFNCRFDTSHEKSRVPKLVYSDALLKISCMAESLQLESSRLQVHNFIKKALHHHCFLNCYCVTVPTRYTHSQKKKPQFKPQKMPIVIRRNPETLKYWLGVHRGQSYLMRRRCVFSLGWPTFQ